MENTIITTDTDRIRRAVMRRFSPLDGIGKDLTSETNYYEALNKSGLGFLPAVKKLYLEDNTKVNGYKALYNGNTLLSVVKDDYTVISNEEAFSIADDLVREDNFTYVTGNIEKGGARCRLVLSGPTIDIAEEDFTPYVILNNSFDLSRSVSIQFMFMRLVCLNGLMRRVPGMTSSIVLTHFGEKDTKLKRLVRFRDTFTDTLAYLRKEAEVFKDTPLSKEEFRKEILPELIKHVFQRDVAAPLSEKQQQRTQSFIESVLSAYDSADTENFNGTAYKVLLTMTDLDSHLVPFVNRNNPDIYINRVLQSEAIVSMANFIGNYIIKTRGLKITL